MTSNTGPSLIHDEAQIELLSTICKDILSSCDPKKLPCMVVSLNARQKYVEEKLPVEGNIRHAIYTKHLLSQIQDFQRLDAYTVEREVDGVRTKITIPNKCLVCYISFNPRSQLVALNHFQQSIINDYVEDAVSQRGYMNIQQELISYVQSKQLDLKKFQELDIDTKESSILHQFYTECSDTLLSDIYFIVETHGGFHVVYKEGKKMQVFHDVLRLDQQKKTGKFYHDGLSRDGKALIKKRIEIPKGVCFPVPGTWQSNHKVRFVTTEEFKRIVNVVD